MFCPDCGAKNPEQRKFCRGCGRNIKAVALAVNGQTIFSTSSRTLDESLVELTRNWLQSQSDGIQAIVQGTIVAAAGVLLGFPLYLFSAQANWHTNWILVWLVLCGWLPVLGAVRAGTGISKLIHSRTIRSSLNEFAAALKQPVDVKASDTKKIGASHPASITEDPIVHLIPRSGE